MGPSLKRFLLAIAVSAIAGGAFAFIGTIVWIFVIGKEADRKWSDALQGASFIGFWTLLVCFVYALVLGFAVYAYLRIRRTTIGLHVAIIAGLLGAIPFVWPFFKENSGGTREAAFIPIFAILSAIVCAWTFWRIALKPQTA